NDGAWVAVEICGCSIQKRATTRAAYSCLEIQAPDSFPNRLTPIPVYRCLCRFHHCRHYRVRGNDGAWVAVEICGCSIQKRATA
ncbi:MAG: hypothetical protein LBI87_11580, partial [Candidatus Accumulibacter sp.]|nr:hypothetical protein [Accumulibacter sp.]